MPRVPTTPRRPRTGKTVKKAEDHRHPTTRTNNPEAGLESFDRKGRVAISSRQALEQRWAAEAEALRRLRPRLMSEYADKWVIVAGGQAVGFFADFETSVSEASRRFPDGGSLVAPVDESRELQVPSVFAEPRADR